MDFYAVLDQVLDLLRQRGAVQAEPSRWSDRPCS